jgi:acyl-CoA hydrolase
MKIVSSVAEALSPITSQSRVFIHAGAATPNELLRGLEAEAYRLKDVELIHLHTEGPAFYGKKEMRSHFKVLNLFVGSNLRGEVDYEGVDYIPCFLSEIPQLFRSGVKPLDAALIQVSPPDRHGFVSLGVSVDVARAAVDTAKVLIAQINPRMPRVHGDGFIHVDQIRYAIEVDEPLYSPRPVVLSEEELSIGKHIAGIVEDGATLQLGIGAIPNAVCSFLKHHRHLGLHTEMWSDGALELIKCGAIDNSLKKFHQHKTTSAFVIGSQELYQFINDNMSVLNLDAAYVNSPLTIMRNPKVTAINSAVEIDLTGQVCADSVGPRVISGVGGQMDFIRAAALSQGGRPILAFTSTSKKGHSRIQGMLRRGAGVVTTRAHVHYVATEYGIVNLFGKSLGERAKALIGIAHPDHRERLEREWFELKASL